MRVAQGLDGEATEPIISSLDDPQASHAAPEEEYRVAMALTAHGHLGMLTQRLQAVISSQAAGRAEVGQLIRLLHHAVQLQVIGGGLGCPQQLAFNLCKPCHRPMKT